MKSLKKLMAAVLTVAMLLTTFGAAFAEAAETVATEDGSTPLVVGYSTFNNKFSSFFSTTQYDTDVCETVGVPLMTTDRTGGIIYNAIEGETVPYNGTDYFYQGISDIDVKIDEASNTTVYTCKIRDDVKFSDGVGMTADDIIFNYYVYLDPSYIGSGTLNSYKIVGYQDYKTQTTSEIYTKYQTIAAAIKDAGVDHVHADADSFTQEQQDAYWAAEKAAWMDDVQDIVNYVYQNYADYASDIGAEAADLDGNDGLQVALGMVEWGFGAYDAGVLTGAATGNTWNLSEGVYPTLEDYYAETYAKYEGSADAFFEVEAADADAASTTATAGDSFISAQAATEPELAGGIPNISGIKKLDDYTVQITTEGYEAPAIYQLFGIVVCPMHYYSDGTYDYDNNNFGHPYGDLSAVESKTSAPLGAGAYKFVKFENKVVYFEANENYYLGEPKTKYMQWKETLEPDKVSSVVTGTSDVGDPSFSKDKISEIKAANSNGELDGDTITVRTTENLGYGYIGMNANNISVGGEAGSEASKQLRTGLATIFAVYRDVAIDSYYGEIASVINYPISNTSWAAPQKTDEDYRVAFSTALDGSPLYTADMTAEQKYAAAKLACIDYLKAAGYTFDDATGKFTAAPEGASLEYEFLIPADGSNDHPAFAIATDAQAAFAEMGITLSINNPADSNELWDKMDNGTAQIWAAAWQATIDPDMYQVYYSGNAIGEGGADSNKYMLMDTDLDQMIVDARNSADQTYRKAVYKAALEKVIEWAVEIPTYQRLNCDIFSPARINIDTIAKDQTTFYTWLREVDKIEMN